MKNVLRRLFCKGCQRFLFTIFFFSIIISPIIHLVFAWVLQFSLKKLKTTPMHLFFLRGGEGEGGASKMYYGRSANVELFTMKKKMYISPRVNHLNWGKNKPKSLIDKGQKPNTERLNTWSKQGDKNIRQEQWKTINQHAKIEVIGVTY